MVPGFAGVGMTRVRPAAGRERYRVEVLAQLSLSERRMRDAADIALTALGLRVDQIRRSQHMIKVAVDIVVVGAVWTTWVVPQLMAPLAVIDDCHLNRRPTAL